jgi:hypothetical protein
MRAHADVLRGGRSAAHGSHRARALRALIINKGTDNPNKITDNPNNDC